MSDDPLEGFITPKNFTLTATPKTKLPPLEEIIKQLPPAEEPVLEQAETADLVIPEEIQLYTLVNTEGLERAIERFNPEKCKDKVINIIMANLNFNAEALKIRLEEIHKVWNETQK